MWPGSAFPFITVCIWPNENIHYFISTGENFSARLSWAEPPVLGNIGGNVKNLSKKGPPCQDRPERLAVFLLSVVIPCVSVIFLLSNMANNFQDLSLHLNHWVFIIYVQKQIMLGFPWSLLLETVLVFLQSLGQPPFLYNHSWFYLLDAEFFWTSLISGLFFLALTTIWQNCGAYLACLEKWSISFRWSLSSVQCKPTGILWIRDNVLDCNDCVPVVIWRIEGEAGLKPSGYCKGCNAEWSETEYGMKAIPGMQN